MDLVTFGEAMLRLTPPGLRRIEQAHSFDAHVGGAELNVAVAAARLGLATRWVSRLPESPLGRMIASRAREQGVDVSHLSWTTRDRAGLYFVELGAAPRASDVLYDRADSAMARISPGVVDWGSALNEARWLHVGGITAALSESAAATLAEALAAAKAASITVSYDLNFRGKLWTAERARATQEPLLPFADVLIAGDDTARAVLGVAGDTPEQVARELRQRFGTPAIAVTTRDATRARTTTWRALVLADDRVHCSPVMDVEIVDPIGAGDAFAAGLIFGRLSADPSWEKSVHYGAALAAIKHTIPGDFCLASLGEVEALVAQARGAAARMLNR